ncbi:C40 family peptidase [Pasteurellaceae bacterium TAE3-ERU1]|uniref:NlpC/P60 family protein n=1 Tax=Spirabiliibacterium mucosae TaxID=28156 RepID=UPI001AAD520A|nr:NlpC/P60 family protein [Spirabiliibacterium mucosae]MBE2898294.1 C40 family peptidase [Spirabiliibacterium mucosae]MBV7387191.1 C40 family peptidase [Pasteurellaceae bacterium TAE3-ERU1]
MWQKWLTIAFTIMLASACTSVQQGTQSVQYRTNTPANMSAKGDFMEFLQLQNFYRKWAGVRYRLGGNTKRGIDCSAFVSRAFANVFGVALPRTTSEQRYVGKRINKADLQPGDLIFFRRNRHVGIYIGNGDFIHASTSQGVTTSSIESGYWARHYSQARRVVN